MGRREVKVCHSSGSPCGAPEVLVRTVTVSAHSDSVSVPGEAGEAFAALQACRGLAAEIPCLSSLPPGLHRSPHVSCRQLSTQGLPVPQCLMHSTFAKRSKANLPLCHVAAHAISWPEPPFHVASQHVSHSCPKARASCQARNRDFPAGEALSVTWSRAVMFCFCLLLFQLCSGLGTGNN